MKKLTSIDDLTPDNKNANKGTERGTQQVEKSLRDCGAGRSIVVDKHGNVIAGNKTLEGFAAMAESDQVIVVPTNGTKLVVVQRIDLDIDSKRGRQLAVLDNRVSQVSLDFDGIVLGELATEYCFASEDLGFTDAELSALLPIDDEKTEKPAKEVACPHCGSRFTP